MRKTEYKMGREEEKKKQERGEKQNEREMEKLRFNGQLSYTR